MKKADLIHWGIRVLVALAMVLTLVPQPAYAAASVTSTVEVTEAITPVPEEDLPENDALFALYAEGKLYSYEMATFGTAAREKLNPVEQSIYDALKAQIESVAANGGSTAFTLSDVPGLKTVWTSEEIFFSDTDTSQVKAAFTAQFSSRAIMMALLSDCPYDLYWFDKTISNAFRTSFSYELYGYEQNGVVTLTEVVVVDLTFRFAVSEDYKAAEDTVISDVSKVATARANALAVVEANASKSPYEKLIAYKEYICQATSYNHPAAEDDYTGGYGDPWQLISVFDGDPSTTVVCEGYAKAFQYLCDLSGIDCISASGYMIGGTGAGGHMWNVVTLDGKNYLVDVTNCDEGTIGAPDKLFQVGAPYENGGYTISGVTFVCDDLDLATENYTPPAEGAIRGDLDLDGDVDAEDLTALARHVGGIELAEGQALRNADVDGSGGVDANDLTTHARYVGGIITGWDQE